MFDIVLNNLKKGDYVICQFGHNDEKNDDASRFTDASKPTSDSSSFKYSLYENYIKLAESKGAIPILATPIVRANKNNDYSGNNGHITSTGDYRKAILELGEEKDVSVIDLTTLTKNYYTEIGYEQAIYLHAMTSGISDSEANINSVDTTHLNVYGAKMVAYMFASALLENECELAGYVDQDKLVAPTKENDLTKNPLYVYTGYSSPNLENYVAVDQFRTLTEGWYGTAFGDTGGDPNSQANGYIAKETSAGVFKVGQYLDSGSNKGKFSSTSDGFAFAFQQVQANKNFTISAKAKEHAQAYSENKLDPNAYKDMEETFIKCGISSPKAVEKVAAITAGAGYLVAKKELDKDATKVQIMKNQAFGKIKWMI